MYRDNNKGASKMGQYYCTINVQNVAKVEAKFGPLELVYTFKPASVVMTFCCARSVTLGQKQNVVVRLTAPNRRSVERSSLIAKTRTNPPEGGWASLDGSTIFSRQC
jgi:hypothetical protein